MKDENPERATVRIDVGIGAGEHGGEAWGCALSYDYVKMYA